MINETEADQRKKLIKHLMSLEEFKGMFNISDGRTAHNYLRGVHSQKIGTDVYFDRQKIYDKIGLKADPTEPFLTSRQLGPILGLKHTQVTNQVKRMKWPHYEFNDSQGGNTYFLLSEIKAAIKDQLKWNSKFPDHLVRSTCIQDMMQCLIKVASPGLLDKKEQEVFTLMTVRNLEPADIASTMDCTKQHVYKLLSEAVPKMELRIQELTEGFKQVDELLRENALLKEENELLKRLTNNVQGRMPNNLSLQQVNLFAGDISVRMENLFKAMDVKTLFEVSQRYTRREAAKFRNVGQKTLDQLQDLLKENGLTWKQ